jgi:hypothetical protein
MKNLFHYISYAKESFILSVITFVLAMAGFLLVGSIYSDLRARALIEGLAPAIHTLCFAVITASATIIPLLLTILSVADRLRTDFDKTFYARVEIIAMLGTIAIASATLLLLFITIPVTENDQLYTWFSAAYYIIIFGASWISALLIGIVSTLYNALMGVIRSVVEESDVSSTPNPS